MGSSTARLLLIGLDNAGKSTILSRIVDPDEKATGITPTIGYKKDSFSRCGMDFDVLDMSGESKYRDLWQSNATNQSEKDQINGIIFVIDSSDKMRIRVARSELEMILENKNISSQIPFLFLANKNDLKGACTLEEVSQLMELSSLKRNHQLVSCSGLTGKGIQEGIEWLCSTVKVSVENSQ